MDDYKPLRYVTMGEFMGRTQASLVPSDRPETPSEGQMYSDKNDHHLYFYNGEEWIQLDSGGAVGGGPPIKGDITDKQVAFGTASNVIDGSDVMQFDSSSNLLTLEGVMSSSAMVLTPMDPTLFRESPPEGAIYYSATDHILYLNTNRGWVALN